MDALVAFALLLLVVLAPRAIMHACCVDAGAALAALALLLLLVLALLLLSLLLLSLWLRRLQCLGLFRLPRFPFHDSQVSKTLLPCACQWVFRTNKVPQCRLPSGRPPGSHLGAIWAHFAS